MGFPAKYSGVCLKCKQDVARGQMISWSRTKGQRGVYHMGCENPSQVEPARHQVMPQAAKPVELEGSPWPIGTKVRVTTKAGYSHYAHIGAIGIVKGVNKNGDKALSIEFQDYIGDNGHECYGDCRAGYGQFLLPSQLELVQDKQDKTEKVILTAPNQDGIETVLEETITMEPKQTEVAEALKALMAAMAPKEKPSIDIEAVRQIVKESLTEHGTLVLEVRQADKPSVKIDLAHNKLPDLIYFTGKRKHTYLHGPHGSGKSTGAQHAAKALGLGYGYISLTPQTPESRLLGYMNATGGYVKTQYRDCYENGGVFCIDELDNGSPALLTTLNGALENGHMAFPDCLVTRHDDFVMVGTGNTSGRGANPSYPERRPFDSAFGDRFVYIEWSYDEKLERKIATGINKDAGVWVTWILSVRRWAAKNHPRFVPSPRATFRLAEFTLDNTVTQENMLDAILWRGDAELRNKVLSNCPLPV